MIDKLRAAAGVMIVFRGRVLVIGWRPDMLSPEATEKLEKIVARQDLDRGQYLSWVLTGKEPDDPWRDDAEAERLIAAIHEQGPEPPEQQ
jgi:hypothetical protein